MLINQPLTLLWLLLVIFRIDYYNSVVILIYGHCQIHEVPALCRNLAVKLHYRRPFKVINKSSLFHKSQTHLCYNRHAMQKLIQPITA